MGVIKKVAWLGTLAVLLVIIILNISIKEQEIRTRAGPESCHPKDCFELNSDECESLAELNCKRGENICLTKYCSDGETEQECKEMGKGCLWKENVCRDNYELPTCMTAYRTRGECEADKQELDCVWVIDRAGRRCQPKFSLCKQLDETSCLQEKDCYWFIGETSCVQKGTDDKEEFKKIMETKFQIAEKCLQIKKREECVVNKYCWWGSSDDSSVILE